MEQRDGVRSHDAAELRREPLELSRLRVVANGGGRVEGQVRDHRGERAVTDGGGAIGVALVAAFGLPAPPAVARSNGEQAPHQESGIGNRADGQMADG